MKHLLIPTDFTIQSLNAIHAAVATYNNQPLKITLFHLLRMPTDIPDLLFPSMRNKHTEMITAEFKEACEILQNRYESIIGSMCVKFGSGSSKAYLRNWLEGEKITTIFTCTDIQLSLPSSRSIEMLSLLKRTGYAMESVSSRALKEEYYQINAINVLQGNEIKLPQPAIDYAVED